MKWFVLATGQTYVPDNILCENCCALLSPSEKELYREITTEYTQLRIVFCYECQIFDDDLSDRYLEKLRSDHNYVVEVIEVELTRSLTRIRELLGNVWARSCQDYLQLHGFYLHDYCRICSRQSTICDIDGCSSVVCSGANCRDQNIVCTTCARRVCSAHFRRCGSCATNVHDACAHVCAAPAMPIRRRQAGSLPEFDFESDSEVLSFPKKNRLPISEEQERKYKMARPRPIGSEY